MNESTIKAVPQWKKGSATGDTGGECQGEDSSRLRLSNSNPVS